jgi:hypothetical protein
MDGRQIAQLAKLIEEVWSLEELTFFARDYLNYNLANQAPSGTLKERALKFIGDMNTAFPPRDRELLIALRDHGNILLQKEAKIQLTPNFFSPPPSQDPHDAILLGRAAFIGRPGLRDVIRDFTFPTNFTTHVLIVKGDEPGGKSYSWEFLRHLAKCCAGAEPRRLELEDKNYTPRGLIEQVCLLLNLNPYGPEGLPPLKDDPQEARIDPLINWITGKLPTLQRRYWLVIDDLNHPSVKRPVAEAAYALAYCVEEIKPDPLWVALLGYNNQSTDPEMRYIALEDASFPDAAMVATYFESISKASALPLSAAEARDYANLLFGKFNVLNKESMMLLTPMVENIGSKLRIGLRP